MCQTTRSFSSLTQIQWFFLLFRFLFSRFSFSILNREKEKRKLRSIYSWWKTCRDLSVNNVEFHNVERNRNDPNSICPFRIDSIRCLRYLARENRSRQKNESPRCWRRYRFVVFFWHLIFNVTLFFKVRRRWFREFISNCFSLLEVIFNWNVWAKMEYSSITVIIKFYQQQFYPNSSFFVIDLLLIPHR